MSNAFEDHAYIVSHQVLEPLLIGIAGIFKVGRQADTSIIQTSLICIECFGHALLLGFDLRVQSIDFGTAIFLLAKKPDRYHHQQRKRDERPHEGGQYFFAL